MKLLLQIMGKEVQQSDRTPPVSFLGLQAAAGGTKPGLGQVEKCPGPRLVSMDRLCHPLLQMALADHSLPDRLCSLGFNPCPLFG